MPRLFLRFIGSAGRTADGGFDVGVDWLVRADDGAAAAEGHVDGGDALADVVRRMAPWAEDPARVVVFVPAAEVLATSCRVPGRSAAQLRRAAPYAVEEYIAEDIDTMHVACGELARNEPVRCLVVPRVSVEDWLACLAAAGVAPGFLTADAMALPVAARQASVLYDGESALVRTEQQVASVDLPNLPAVLDALRMSFQEAEQPAALLQINGTLSDMHLGQSAFAADEVKNVRIAGSLLDYLAGAFEESRAISLLQGDFTVKRRTSDAWEQWRSVAAAAGAWLAITLLVLIAEGFWADYKAGELRAEATQLYREIYGVGRVPGNPAAHMRRLLGQAPVARVGFHHLLGNLGVTLRDHAGRYELQSISYSERNGLGAEVVVADYDALEKLQAGLGERGFAAELVSAEQQQGRVRANLRVGGT